MGTVTYGIHVCLGFARARPCETQFGFGIIEIGFCGAQQEEIGIDAIRIGCLATVATTVCPLYGSEALFELLVVPYPRRGHGHHLPRHESPWP